MTERTSEGTNHDYTRPETLRCEISKANFANDCAEALPLILRLAKLRDERVGGVRDDSANDTGEVSRRKGDAELRSFAVRVFGLSEQARIELLHDLLETEELGHRVWNLWEELEGLVLVL
jgi:hypothetical protein